MFLRRYGRQKRNREREALTVFPLKMSNLHEQLTAKYRKCAPGGFLCIAPPSMYRNLRGDCIFPNSGALPAISDKVTHLDLSGNSFADYVWVPKTVRWLNVSATNYASWIIRVPDTLESLTYTNHSTTSCPAFPPGLKYLNVSDLGVYSLPPLPPTLEVLVVKDCYNLTHLPDLPPTLRVLDMQGCHAVKTLPDFPDSLEELWAGGCRGLPQEIRNSFSYWDLPRWIRLQQQEVAKVRQQKRTRALRQEIVAEAYHPRRVERWLETKGWGVLEEMLG